MNILFPPSACRIPTSRRGVTLAEVLISMAILTIGLLGAAAMFPVGSYYLQKGEIADRGAAIAQAAFADLVARGDLKADNWRVWQSGNNSPVMRSSMIQWMENNANAPTAADYQTSMNSALGCVYVIDPLGVASAAKAGLPWRASMMAPYAADAIDTNPEAVGGTEIASFGQWGAFAGDDGENSWPVRRLCTNSMVIAGVPNEAVADTIYQSADDLVFEPSQQDDATRQWLVGPDANGDNQPDVALARQSTGDYSWLATIAPTQSRAREALALDPAAYYYDVSVVVFFKRPLNDISLSERLVGGRVISTGTGGGELLLTQLQGDTTPEPFAELKSGQWVMVSGPHELSTPARPLFFTQWYKVLAVDDQPRGNGFTSETQQRIVGLRGPDWPWQPGRPVRVGLFPGAVAVHTKTMRLESFGEYAR